VRLSEVKEARRQAVEGLIRERTQLHSATGLCSTSVVESLLSQQDGCSTLRAAAEHQEPKVSVFLVCLHTVAARIVEPLFVVFCGVKA
jgi:hypothetical protein